MTTVVVENKRYTIGRVYMDEHRTMCILKSSGSNGFSVMSLNNGGEWVCRRLYKVDSPIIGEVEELPEEKNWYLCKTGHQDEATIRPLYYLDHKFYTRVSDKGLAAGTIIRYDDVIVIRKLS